MNNYISKCLYLSLIGVKDEAGNNVYPVGYTWSTTRDAAGTKVIYYHEKNEDADKVYIPGPTKAQLKVYVRHFNVYFWSMK